jgi:hypothetical protein
MTEIMPNQIPPIANDLDTYKVDFTWKKFKGIITDNKTSAPIMDIDCKRMTKPHLKFKNPKNELIGTASFNVVSIHAECEIRGRPKRIQAMKRWTTEYTYLSDAFAQGSDAPVPMYWTSSSGFKHWDFILLDSNKEPVARFHSNIWAVSKLGFLEFMGDYSAETKEEICITACSVYYNTLLRMNNVFQFFGAIGAKTGPIQTNDAGATDVQLKSNPAHKAADMDTAAYSTSVEPSKNRVVR